MVVCLAPSDTLPQLEVGGRTRGQGWDWIRQGLMTPGLGGLMGGGLRRGCSRALKPISAHRALALGILGYSPTEPPRGLWKRPSLWPSPLLGALSEGWGAELDALSEGSGGPHPPAEPENLGWNLPLPGSPCKSWRTRTLQVWKKQPGHNHLDKTNPQSRQNPLRVHEGFHTGMIPALKPLASPGHSRLWLT